VKDPYKRSYRNKNAQKQRRLNKMAKRSGKPCEYKRSYSHKLDAEIACRKESLEACIELWIYKCPFCRDWHLTSSPPRK